MTPARILPIVVALLRVATAAQADQALSSKALQEMGRVAAEIDRIETATLERLPNPPDNRVQQLELLGKSMHYDRQLSVNRNEACAFCHMPGTGFTGPVSELNATTGAYPGSVRTRFSNRKTQTRSLCRAVARAALQSGPGRSRGRQFLEHARDQPQARQCCSRAGGRSAGQPSGGRPDTACAVYRASLRLIQPPAGLSLLPVARRHGSAAGYR